jgi:hypothetical protein
MRVPSGTSASGASRITFPSASDAPRVSTSVAGLAGCTALTEAHGDEEAADAAAAFCDAVRVAPRIAATRNVTR